jgi:Site-specific recombinase XerD
MPKLKLTKTVVDRLSPGEVDVIYWDTEITGLGVKVTPKGRKVFLVQYRPSGAVGNSRKITIGTYGEFTVDQARREALTITEAKARGRDPQAEKRAAKKNIATNRFDDLVDRFLAQHASKNRTGYETKRILEYDFLKAWSNLSVHEIKRRHIIDILEKISARTSGPMANRALAAIRKFFNWCVAKDILTSSPCEGVEAPAREKSRDRVLSNDELQAIILAARQIGFPYGSIVEMLALTGQRRDEVARMQRSHVNFDKAIWTIPAEHSKNGKAHMVHLSDAALDVIRSLPVTGDLVFSENGQKPFQGWSKAKARLDRIALVKLSEHVEKRGGDKSKVEFPEWRHHDLRRTMVTGMMEFNVSHYVADKVLNHQSGAISGVAAVYQRNEFLAERKSALEIWGSHITALLKEYEQFAA